MKRRAFLTFLGSAFRAPGACPVPGTGSGNVPLDESSATPHVFNEPQCLKRPLLSELDANALATLQRGYAALRQQSGALSLVEQGVWHQARTHVRGANIHHNGLFLPWHRAFLYFHERSLRAALRDPSFRLPAWDWESNKGLGLPAAFSSGALASSRLPDYEKTARAKGVTPARWLDLLTHSLDYMTYGGSYPSGAGESKEGAHDHIHRAVGECMANLGTAAFDPAFYVHHANVDRHWSQWQARVSQCGSPRGIGDVLAEAMRYPMYFMDIDPWQPDQPPRLVSVCADDLLDHRKMGYDYAPAAGLPCEGYQYHAFQLEGGQLVAPNVDGARPVRRTIHVRGISGAVEADQRLEMKFVDQHGKTQVVNLGLVSLGVSHHEPVDSAALLASLPAQHEVRRIQQLRLVRPGLLQRVRRGTVVPLEKVAVSITSSPPLP